MKIGILTLPITENYGGILQALALYRTLNNEGHDVILIYKESYPSKWKEIIKKILLFIPFHNFKNTKTNNKINKIKLERTKFHREFIEKEIFKISKTLYTTEDLKHFVNEENFDAIIVGSDQVWRKTYINDIYYKSYFLDFVDSSKTKKIAYAASFGKDYWEGSDDIENISKLLKDFTALSTREISGVKICKNTFNYNHAEHVIDPTLLMDKEFYKNEIISKYNISNTKKGGIVTYILDENQEKDKIINYLKNNLDFKLLNHLKGFSTSQSKYTVPEWLSSFLNADYIITDSFHGMVFSIIFNKNFTVIGNQERGLDRFKSLLTLLKLENRLVSTLDELLNDKLIDINYNEVNILLNKNKELSYNFLLASINSTKEKL